MLWIEGVRGGPLCGVPVQCSQVGHDHGALEKAEKTRARHDTHNIHVQWGSSPPGSYINVDSTPNSLKLPNQVTSESNPYDSALCHGSV